MNANLERLIALQQYDLEIKRLRESLAEAPRRIAAAETLLKKSQTAVAAAQGALKKEEVLRRSQQVDAGDSRARIERLQKQMETATSAAQITALEHEIAFAQAAIVRLEDDELASMERTETLDAALARHTADTAAHTAALADERARGARSVAADTAALASTESARKGLRSTIEESLLAQYDRVAKSRGTAVSEAVDHKCSACQMMLRPQRWNDLVGREFRETLFSCESCGRLLWYDPRRDAPSDWKPGDISSGAAEAGVPR